MEFHEYANIFPLMQGEEFGELVEAIKTSGLNHSIWVYEGKILDGRNRYRACIEAGLEPRYKTYTGNDPIQFILDENLRRRQLTSGQKAMAALELEKILAVEAEKRKQATQFGATTAVQNFAQPQETGRAAEQAAAMMGTNHTYVTDAKRVNEYPELAQQVIAGTKPLYEAAREIRVKDKAAVIAQLKDTGVVLPTGKYATIVIDPPWPVSFVDRGLVRPNQVDFDYPLMSEEELQKFPIPDIAADDCHLYLWVTHKHMPMGLRLVEHWGFKYQCLMTWVKNVGFTPFSWMYSTEHVLFCHKGNLPLLQFGMRLDFEGKVREHSRKPDEFYELVKKASPGPRIDVFSRGGHDGFAQYGNEVERFG